MSNPGSAATQEKGQGSEDTNRSFADKVENTLKNVTVDDKGSLTFPEGTSEEVKYAVKAEKRRRDTQAAYTKTNQKAKALEAENSVLLKKAMSGARLTLTDAQKEELENLKFEDPEAWRQKMNAYEAEARSKYRTELDEDVKKVSATSLEEDELKQREQVLSEFLRTHEGFNLTDDVLKNDIPPRITKKLENGDITFEDFLNECYEYINTGKVVQQDKLTAKPNLNRTGGSSSPDKHAVQEDAILSYKKESY